MGWIAHCVVAVTLCAAGPASAETLLEKAAPPTYRWNGGLFLGGHFVSADNEFGNSFFDDQVPGSAFLFGLRGGFALFPHMAPGTTIDPALNLELEGGMSWSHTDGNDMRPSEFTPLLGARVHAMMELWAPKGFSPFVLLGGGMQTVISSSKFLDAPDTDLALHAGLGALVDIGQRTGLRADFRMGLTPARDQGIAPLFEATLGVFYRFGAQPHATDLPPPVPAAREIARDLAPPHVETPKPTEAPYVAPRPWTALAILDAPKPAAETPIPAAEAPATETPVPTTDNRAALSRWNGVVKGISFANASTRLTKRSEANLDDLVQALRDNPSARLRISGHTDDIGGKKQNQQLSARRARRVKEYLVKQGIDPKRIEARGYGMDKPIASNDSKEGRARNRRIEFKILSGGN